MNRRLLAGIGIVIGVIVIIGVVLLARIWLVGGSGEASQALVAPTLAVDQPTAEPTAETAADPTDEPASSAEAAVEAGPRVRYQISSEASEVRFTLNEVLRGTPTTVVGRTDQVAGEILVDFGAPSASELGLIVINARTLATDNEFRNRALRSDILQSAQDRFEFITFTPTAFDGLPDVAADGDTVSFSVAGDLTIRDITNPVTFTVAVTASAERLSGSASASVMRAAYNLTIPDVPGVAEVTEEVLLEIDFVALPVE